MDQGHRNPSLVPVFNILAFLDIPGCQPHLRKPDADPLPVMLEPVGDQDRLPICRLDQVFQRVQLPLMDKP